MMDNETRGRQKVPASLTNLSPNLPRDEKQCYLFKKKNKKQTAWQIYLVAFDDVNLFLGCAELHHQSQHRSIALVWFKTENDRQVLIHQILVLMRRKKKAAH